MAGETLTTKTYRDRKIAQQKETMRYIYPTQKIVVAAATGNNPGSSDYQLVIGADADFHILGVTGSYGFLYAKNPAEPVSSTNPIIAHSAPQDGAEDVAVRMTDAATGRLLTEGYVDLELFMSPGAAGNPLRLIYEMDHIITRSKHIRLEFLNYDSDICQVQMAFHGRKYF